MDNLEFLDGAEAPKDEVQPQEPQAEVKAEPTPAEPAAEAAPTETAEQKASRERDEKGRFKAKEAEEPVMVPLKALHETRDEVKALKEQLAALQQPQAQAKQVPDIFEDPDGFVQYQNQQLQNAMLNTTLNISEEMTRASAGSETVDEAQKWGAQEFAKNPALYHQFLQQRNPYGFLVEQYKRASLVSQLGDDPTEIQAYLAWKQAQQAPQPAQATPQPELPPASIAAAPSAGGMQHIPTGPGAAFDSVIK